MRGGTSHPIVRDSNVPVDGYGKTFGQMGAMPSSFWGAARLVVASCHDVLRPGGVAVWVTKNYCRKKRIVPFSDRWLELNLSCGFELIETIIASQTDNAGLVQGGLFGNDEPLEKRRAGLFRILYEKRGGPVVDFETVHVLRKS